MDAEGFLERERRWMEGIFAASRPEDLSCLFHDTYGSKKFNPDDFFPMVMNERVAWPEFMAMARTALFKSAGATVNKLGAAVDASNGINRKFTSGGGGGGGGGGDKGTVTVGSASMSPKYGAGAGSAPIATAAEVSRGGGGGAGGGTGSSGSSKEKQDGDNATQRQKQHHQDGEELRRQDSSHASPRRTKPLGTLSATAGGNNRSSSNALALTGEEHFASNEAAITVVPLAFGVTARGKTTPGPDARNLFRFELPSPGPVITVVLDSIDGDPEMFVSRRRVPRGARGSGAATATAAAATNVTSVVDSGDWTNSSTYGTLRVMKIFPHDPK